MRWWSLLFFGCSNPNPPATPADAPAAQAPEAPARAEVPAGTVFTEAGAREGWGAVFWRDGAAVRVGGGDVVLGASGAGAVIAGEPGPCSGVKITGAPERAVIALPAGRAAPTAAPPAAPANPAALVERAAWRLDEALPPRDAWSPATSAPDPALQRGVHLASAVKTRRPNAPPLILASGARDCHGVVAVLDANADHALLADWLDGLCEPLSLMPAADLDGDGVREVVAWSDTRVVLYRLGDGNTPTLTRIGDWSCPATPSGGGASGG